MKDRHIKAELHNELHCVGAIKGLDYVYSKEKMGVADLCALMYKIYHGDAAEGIASNAKMISEGTGDFAALYNVEMIAIMDPTSMKLDSATSKTLKTLFLAATSVYSSRWGLNKKKSHVSPFALAS